LTARDFTCITCSAAVKTIFWLIVAALWLELAPSSALGAQALSVCAEPDNLPFSHRGGPRKGFYLELADALGKALHRPVRYVWIEGWGLGGVKTAFAQRQCDVYFGLPALSAFSAPYLSLTRPFARESYALVMRKGIAIRSVAELVGKRIAVQYGTPPQMLLAANDIDLLTCDTVAEAMTALTRGEVSAAFLWGPAAGYYNKDTLHNAYEVLPTAGRGLDWPVAIGVRKDQIELLDALNGKLDGLRPVISQLEQEYGFPTSAPIVLAARITEEPYVRLAIADGGPSVDGDSSESSAPAPDSWIAAQAAAGNTGETAATMSPAASEGRSLFNSRCAHCHGNDAITGNTERSIPDLLRKIPPDQMEAFFIAVVTNGEPDQGMPPWKGALTAEQMKKIFAFIRWAQDHPPKD
jgi:polar amino acid transport system substrate-binding protein